MESSSIITPPNKKQIEEFIGAVKTGNSLWVNRLLEKHPTLINVQDDAGNTALHIAMSTLQRDDQRRMIEVLSTARPNIDLPNSAGATAMMLAAQGADMKSLQLLLPLTDQWGATSTSGANIFHCLAQNPRCDTAMVQAIQERCQELKQIPNINGNYSREGGGDTPLCSAAAWGNQGAILAFIAKGADVNQQDGFGRTPIMCAVNRVSPGLTKILVKAGANVEFVNKKLKSLPSVIEAERRFPGSMKHMEGVLQAGKKDRKELTTTSASSSTSHSSSFTSPASSSAPSSSSSSSATVSSVTSALFYHSATPTSDSSSASASDTASNLPRPTNPFSKEGP